MSDISNLMERLVRAADVFEEHQAAAGRASAIVSDLAGQIARHPDVESMTAGQIEKLEAAGDMARRTNTALATIYGNLQ